MSLVLHVFIFEVFVVELSIQVLVVINPGANHVWVLLVEVRVLWFTVKQNWFVETNVIGFKSLVAPKHVLTPQIRMLTAFVHSCVRFEFLLNIVLIFIKRDLNVLRVRISSQDSVKVAAHGVLLLVETIEIELLAAPDVLRLQFTQGSLIQSADLLVLS